MRERVRLSLHSRNCDLPAVAHFDPRLAGIGRADDCFCRFQFWLIVINIQQKKFNLIQKAQEAYLFIVYIYKLLSM